ncbi:hypothetical protein E2562_033272 [Oryza meyeriana var. granulata]|uniref:Uncharacterized protein n=1 Tax=Oryza meyeriana var. granulata TaxID=110450 RepID=A0A6G1CXQ5_9ORYZ|nr:hypothetical protein E2562_033272 [Oryza meyeriana var. granulata]
MDLTHARFSPFTGWPGCSHASTVDHTSSAMASDAGANIARMSVKFLVDIGRDSATSRRKKGPRAEAGMM